MSSDHQVLTALAAKTGEDLRYFELVSIICGDLHRRCYLCIGKHSLFFVRRDMSSLLHREGKELMYAYVAKVVQDQNTHTHLLLALTENKPAEWYSERLFVQSNHREQLVKHLQCNWQTDHMWRLGIAAPLPLFTYPITRGTADKQHIVGPFIGHRWESYSGYKFMVPYDFKHHANAIRADETGEYVDSKNATLFVQVHEALSLDQLKALKRDHIRWVAAEYKAQLVQHETQFYVLRNSVYNKRMNLAADVSAWFAWEIVIRIKQAALICVLLRRQYVPPVCCTAQDIVVVMRVPAEEAAAKTALQSRILMTRCIADTLCVDSADAHMVYHEIVQAKLDALRFDEEGQEWIAAHLKLASRMRTQAKIFVRIVLRMFHQDDAMPDASSILDRPAPAVFAGGGGSSDESSDEWPELTSQEEPMDLFLERMRQAGDGLPQVDEQDFCNPRRAKDNTVVHSWYFRVARYFAWAIDGGLLGSLCTLDKIIERIPFLTEGNQKKCMLAIIFLLHARPHDMSKPWVEGSLLVILMDQSFKDYVFNDRVMYSILSTEFLKKQFGRQKEKEYYQCLAHLLDHRGSASLIAYICRICMEAKTHPQPSDEDVHMHILLQPLLDLLHTGGVFMATYAAAALVNLSSGEEQVKITLLSQGIAGICVDLIKVKDDDLLCYVLMLMVNLTKEPNKRVVFREKGALPLIYDLLTSTYHLCNPHKDTVNRGVSATSGGTAVLKEKVLINVSALIGQFCNDENVRERFIAMFTSTRQCLIYMFEKSMKGGMLAAKTLFALRPLCAANSEQLQYVGSHVIKTLVEEMMKVPSHASEFMMQAILLVETLCKHAPNCELVLVALAGKTTETEKLRLALSDFVTTLVNCKARDKLKSRGFEERVSAVQKQLYKHLENVQIMRGEEMADHYVGLI